MIEEQHDRWEVLLDSWKSDVLSVWSTHRDKWLEIGLPDVNELQRTPVDLPAVERLEARWGGALDPEVLGFYKTTDAWPLWLGSFWARMLPASQVDLFLCMYPDAYSIAEGSAPTSRILSGSSVEISKDDLVTAVALTQPDARELVLSLRSGETCFYFFDDMRIYRNFYVFMKHRRIEVKEWLLDMLGA